MNLKNKLAAQATKPLAVSHKGAAVSQLSEIEKITQVIRADLLEMKEIEEFVVHKRVRYVELRENVVKNLIYVRDHKKALQISSFENYLEESIGITKGYFYEQVQAYEICQIYQKPELFSQVDYKILVMIARVKDKEEQKKLIEQARNLSRNSFKKVSPTDLDNSVLRVKKINEKGIQIEFLRPLTQEEQKKLIALILEQGQNL